nr:MAG TPA: hypothetical protein [Caudoviricetes sp.]
MEFVNCLVNRCVNYIHANRKSLNWKQQGDSVLSYKRF